MRAPSTPAGMVVGTCKAPRGTSHCRQQMVGSQLQSYHVSILVLTREFTSLEEQIVLQGEFHYNCFQKSDGRWVDILQHIKSHEMRESL